MQTILEILNKSISYFQSKGVPNAKLDAQCLLAGALNCKRLELFLRFEEPLTGESLDKVRDFVRRRARREPLQYILGKTDFFGISIKCDARALIPRPETENLCDILASKYFTDEHAALDILELGVGSGAVSLALKNHFKRAKVFGVDKSPQALSLARENAAELGLEADFRESDWFEKVEGKYDLIFANPPYLTDAEVESAQPEVSRFEPILALRSDDEGIADLRKILSAAPDFLKDGALIACECGILHPKVLAEEFGETYSKIETLPDMSGRMRYILCRK